MVEREELDEGVNCVRMLNHGVKTYETPKLALLL